MRKKAYIEMLLVDWNLLKEALFEKGITVIQIFLNLIIDAISKLLKNCWEIKNSEQRSNFEEKVENLLTKFYQDYSKYLEKCISINQNLHNTKPEALKTIIL